uniref:Uncharacterized protein n=1 Tax=Aegilops tauschii subsp. strangulata TaxID=200361 RepID=A0A453SSI7_AEGTS
MLTTCYIHWGSCDCIMYSHDKDRLFFRFFKLDMIALEWSSLHDQELDHINCFLYKGQSIQAKEEGKIKVVVAGRSRRAETTECLTSCWPVHTL